MLALKGSSVLQLLASRALDLLFQMVWHEIKADDFPPSATDFLSLFAQMTVHILQLSAPKHSNSPWQHELWLNFSCHPALSLIPRATSL